MEYLITVWLLRNITMLKTVKDATSEQLRKLAQEALQQIEEKQYDTAIKSRRNSPVFKYCVAFSGKHVEIISV